MRFGYSNTNPYENQSKNKHVRSIRRNPESYCEHLFLLMGQYESMADVVTFLELSNPRIDDQHGDWAWISYGVDDDEENRSVIKVRNGYDWSMLDEVVGLPDGADPITGYKRIF